jgi:hypothetical protein
VGVGAVGADEVLEAIVEHIGDFEGFVLVLDLGVGAL